MTQAWSRIEAAPLGWLLVSGSPDVSGSNRRMMGDCAIETAFYADLSA